MAERIPLNAVQTAVYTALTGDATLTALGVSVADWLSDPVSMPAVIIGRYTQERDSTKRTPVSNPVIELDCWSDTKGYKEVNQIADAVVQVLTSSTPLTLSGNFQATNGVLEDVTAFADTDPEGNIARRANIRISLHVADLA